MAAILQIMVYPVRRGAVGAFDAFLGVRFLGRSFEPLLYAARHLAADGVAADTILEMWHAGASEWALRGTLGELAKLRITESGTGRPCVRQWRAYQGRRR